MGLLFLVKQHEGQLRTYGLTQTEVLCWETPWSHYCGEEGLGNDLWAPPIPPHPKPRWGYLIQAEVGAIPEVGLKEFTLPLTFVCILPCKSGILPDFFSCGCFLIPLGASFPTSFQKDSLLTSLELQWSLRFEFPEVMEITEFIYVLLCPNMLSEHCVCSEI